MLERLFERGPRRVKPNGLFTVEIVGLSRGGLEETYHLLLAAPWWEVLLLAFVLFLGANASFGAAYQLVGGVQNADPLSFADHFFFSVQTFGTIGYGAMYPVGRAAHLLVTFESFCSAIGLALITGLSFAKFARPTARVLFTKNVVVVNRDGKPCLMFRLGNARATLVAEATVRVSYLRSARTLEGESYRQILDLKLDRTTSPAFVLTWTVIHRIDESSPLFGVSPESLEKENGELVVTFTGLESVLNQTVHARYTWRPQDFAFGKRFRDVIVPGSNGLRRLDYGFFDDLVDENHQSPLSLPPPR